MQTSMAMAMAIKMALSLAEPERARRALEQGLPAKLTTRGVRQTKPTVSQASRNAHSLQQVRIYQQQPRSL